MTRKEKIIDEEVIRRIAQARRNTTASLDLSRLTISNEGLGEIATHLATLTSLRSLNLTGCNQIADLSPLSTLSTLQSLNLSGCNQIADLSPLSALASLGTLNLESCSRIVDLTPLSTLTSLQTLSLIDCSRIVDLSPLSMLTSLQKLSLTLCGNIADLSPLSALTSLQTLNLSSCRNIADLSPLSTLASLQILNLGHCNKIVDLTPLSALTSLQILNLRNCNNVTDLTPLSSLTALPSLYLRECSQIADLTPLSGLFSLKTLDIERCPGLKVFYPILPLLQNLEALHLNGCDFQDLPRAVLGGGSGKDTLEKLRSHYADLESGTAEDTEVKVLLLGNGSAGKTQLSRRLRHLPYNDQIPSTHGIQLESTSIALMSGGPLTRLNFWDFGGQEIYHGTHALFVQGRSVYLIVWTPELESGAPYVEDNIPMRHRPLPYWLDYLRAFVGAGIPLKVDAPVIVIQSKCDGRIDHVPEPPTLDTKDFRFLVKEKVSCKKGLYLDDVRTALQQAVRLTLEQCGPIPIGIGRARVRDRLRGLLSENPAANRLLDRVRFNEICDEGRDISNRDALLDYLHHAGVIFHRPTIFAGKIVLDQNWALRAIYSLFDRERVLLILQKLGGRFTRTVIEDLAWSQYSRMEQEVFLGMMEDCGICFRVRKLRDEEWEYIAPELVPEWSQAKRNIVVPYGEFPPMAQVEARFSFLHEGILRSYLSRVGKHAANDANYWRYGFAFREETTKSTILMQSAWENLEAQIGPGSLKFTAWGIGASELVQALLQELQQLPIGQQPAIDWKIQRGALQRDIDNTQGLAGMEIAPVGSEPSSYPEVYLSYAWGDDKSEAGKKRKEIADGIETSAKKEGWIVRRDRDEIAPGGSIKEFMSRIHHGGLVIVILSERYLQSVRCMNELNGIFLDARSDEEEFRSRIVAVVLDDAKIGTASGRAEIAQYWESRLMELETRFKHLALPDLLDYGHMKGWCWRIGEILYYISDTRNPWGYEDIVRDDYATFRKTLSSRRKRP